MSDMMPGKIIRIIHILIALQAGDNCTVDSLSKLFNKSRRTILRDLKELKAIGVPYRYNTRTASYTIDPEFFLPPIDLNFREAFSLFLLTHKVANQIQLPFRSSAALAALKIENNLLPKIRRDYNAALRNISVRLQPQATTSLLDKTFGQLQRAIAEKRIVVIKYRSFSEGRDIDTELYPYHLMFNCNCWYVLGFAGIYSSTHTFQINRIKDLTILDRCFISDKEFDLREYIGRAWSIFPEGKIYNIILRFLPKVAEDVSEVQWHSTQKITRNSDGSAIVEFRVDGLSEITWWILSYGDQVQVIAPQVLRNKILEIAKNMVKLNEQKQETEEPAGDQP
jgi:predicted DNA-binding transcriptional regulator YafY